MSQNYYKISRLANRALLEYRRTKAQKRIPDAELKIWKKPDVHKMRQYALKPYDQPAQPTFAHFDDKQQYIKEIKEKWQYDYGKHILFIQC